MSVSRAWGWGLMALGGAIGVLLLLWMAVAGLRAGGFVLGLVLVVVLALPLIGGGYYLLRRSRVEETEEAGFEVRRRVLEGDRLFRQQAAADLRLLADRLASGAGARAGSATARSGADAGVSAAPDPALEPIVARLRAVAQRVADSRRDEAAWYEANPVADADLPTLQRYEDALQAERDRLADLVARAGAAGAGVEALQAALDGWERTYSQREALLLRGRRGPAVAPEALLRARTPSRGAAALNALALGDAATVDFEDYLVQGVLSYFAGGRTWHLYILRDGDAERWLWGAPGGLTWAVLEPLAAPVPEAAAFAAGSPPATFTVEDVALPLVERGSATVDLTTVAGAERSIAVDYWRYAGDDRRTAWVERWPNEVRAGVGRETFPDSIAVWPQTAPAAGTAAAPAD
jgi:hypothetical protein